MGYKGLSRLAHSVLREYEHRADIVVTDQVFEDALNLARQLEREGETDLIITAGANATILRPALKLPVVTIKVTGYDVMVALMKARAVSERVGIVTYRDPIPELEATKSLLKLEVSQRTYQTLADARDCFRSLAAQGYKVIVGSSVVVDLAEQSGIVGILAYSQTSIRQAIEDGIEIARISRIESARYDQLNTVLHHLQEAVLAVDSANRITAINPAMERIIGITHPDALGKLLHELVPPLSLQGVLASGVEVLGVVVQLNLTTCVANFIPIQQNGVTSGAVLTLQDARVIQRADSNLRTQRRVGSLSARYHFHQIVGSNKEFVQTRLAAERFAGSNSTVLIAGVSGTGKELFAQSIHNASHRRDKPFVAVNCASFPEPLLESELFGYEEGAFTGSRKGGKPGLFEVAHTGTIFLDEIGDMPISLQTRLLRILQEKEVVRLGSAQPVPIDVRVIAATHENLALRAKAGLFRVDLYYRLNILQLRLPALRERVEDIPILALQILHAALRRSGSSLPADQALAPLMPYLRSYLWPGNVRELENVAERLAVSLSAYRSAKEIDYGEFSKSIPEIFSMEETEHVVRAAPNLLANKISLDDAIKATEGNRQLAAKMLGISRTTLWRHLKAAETP
jgi:propionate catabolism operon transcriptional regulator